jgi:hypothetical protein
LWIAARLSPTSCSPPSASTHHLEELGDKLSTCWAHRPGQGCQSGSRTCR